MDFEEAEIITDNLLGEVLMYREKNTDNYII
jgi:hypothetical protein